MEAIKIIQESIKTHKDWAGFLEKHPDAEHYEGYKHIGNSEFHRKCIVSYEKVITEIEKLQAELKQLQFEIDRLNSTEFVSYCRSVTKKNEQLQAELDNLKKFARHVIKVECWSIHDQDGGDIQDLAEKLGLIQKHIATEADVDPEIDDFEVGDIIYKYSEDLKGGE